MAKNDQEVEISLGDKQPAPGQIIAPGSPVQSDQPPVATPAPAPKPSPIPDPVPAPAPAAPPAPTQVADEPETESPQDLPGSITWTASEFIAHEKNSGWYFGLAVFAAFASTLAYLISKDFISVGVVIVGAIIFGMYGARKPRQLEYRVDSRGIGIGGKNHGYEEFRSYSVIPEGAFSSITFMPLKRFGAPISIYYAPEDEEAITGLLSNTLPFEEHKLDAVDRLMRRIRF